MKLRRRWLAALLAAVLLLSLLPAAALAAEGGEPLEEVNIEFTWEGRRYGMTLTQADRMIVVQATETERRPYAIFYHPGATVRVAETMGGTGDFTDGFFLEANYDFGQDGVAQAGTVYSIEEVYARLTTLLPGGGDPAEGTGVLGLGPVFLVPWSEEALGWYESEGELGNLDLFAVGTDELPTVTAVPTGIQADSVFITEGYGSLTRWVDGSPTFALMGPDGELVFDYGDFPCSYHLYDGVFVNGLEPSQTYTLFNLEGEQVLEQSYAHLTFRNGYGVALTVVSQDGWNQVVRREVIDQAGNVLLTLPDGFNLSIGISGDPNAFANQSWETNYFGDVGGYGDGLMWLFTGSGVQEHIAEAQELTEESEAYQQNSYQMSCFGGPYCGYVDLEGNVVVTPQYYRATAFSDGLAAVQEYIAPAGAVEDLPFGTSLGGRWKYIDTTGADAFTGGFRYSGASAFSNGYAYIVNDAGKYGYIDTTGMVVLPMIYDDAFGAGDDLFTVGLLTDGQMRYGIVNRDRREVVPLEYDDISAFENGTAYAIKDGQVYLLTTEEPSAPQPGGLTRAELAELVQARFLYPVPEGGSSFTDLADCTQAQRQAIAALEEAGLITGTSPGVFSPHEGLSRWQAVMVLWRALGSPSGEGLETPYTDLAGLLPVAEPAIAALYDQGVLTGDDAVDGAFRPSDPITAGEFGVWMNRLALTRAEFARLLYEKFRPAPLPPEGEEPRTEDFPDIGPAADGEPDPCTDAQRTAIGALYSAYILDGLSDGIFLPRGSVTRAEAVVLLWRAAGRGEADGAPDQLFNNVPENLKPAFDYLTALGVLTQADGVDGSFDLNRLMDYETLELWLSRLITRVEAAELLCRFIQFPPAQDPGFVDLGSCTDSQRADIAALVEAGLLNGVSQTRFAPNVPITYDMVAVVMCRIASGDVSVRDLELALIYLEGNGLLTPEETAMIAQRPRAAADPQQILQWMTRQPQLPADQELGLIATEEGKTVVIIRVDDAVVAEERPLLVVARYEDGRMSEAALVRVDQAGLQLLDLSAGSGGEYRVFLLTEESAPLCQAAIQAAAP